MDKIKPVKSDFARYLKYLEGAEDLESTSDIHTKADMSFSSKIAKFFPNSNIQELWRDMLADIKT